MNVVTHEAEKCQNELAYCKGSWFSEARFSIILKWMEAYHKRLVAEEQSHNKVASKNENPAS